MTDAAPRTLDEPLDPGSDAHDLEVADLSAYEGWSELEDDENSTGARDLQDRAALRRVQGLSTELTDVTEVEYRQMRLERVVLVGVWTEGTLRDAERSLAELARLAETAGSVVVDGLMQRRDQPDPATYIGSGKAKELRDVVVATGADTVIADGELTPGQLRQLEDVVKVKVVDRTCADPRHLRPARHAAGGQGAGLARPDAVPPAAPARLGRVALAGRAVAPVARAAAWARVVRVRRRSRPTVGGSTPRWPSCAARSRR